MNPYAGEKQHIVLDEAQEITMNLQASAGPNKVPELMSTHPDPENRVEKIKEAIKKHKNQ